MFSDWDVAASYDELERIYRRRAFWREVRFWLILGAAVFGVMYLVINAKGL
jgi:hypothetical protein